jgi:hypothetical protein
MEAIITSTVHVLQVRLYGIELISLIYLSKTGSQLNERRTVTPKVSGWTIEKTNTHTSSKTGQFVVRVVSRLDMAVL